MKQYKSIFEAEDKKPKTQEIVDELINTGWSGDNESQMKAVQLLKGLATSDDPKANEFMKKLDKATSGMKSENGKSEKKESYTDYEIYRRGNEMPPKTNWSDFAEEFNIGISDMDVFANILGYRDFEDLDISISPKSLFKRDPRKFTKAIQKSALSARDFDVDDVKEIVDGLWG